MSEPNSRKGRFDWLTLWAALLSLFLALHLLLVSAFANSGSGESGITSWDIRRYWSEAGLLIAVQVGLLVRAIVQRRGGLVSLSSVALLGAAGFSLLFSVPQIDLKPDPPVYTTHPDYEPCYSGSGDCWGG